MMNIENLKNGAKESKKSFKLTGTLVGFNLTHTDKTKAYDFELGKFTEEAGQLLVGDKGAWTRGEDFKKPHLVIRLNKYKDIKNNDLTVIGTVDVPVYLDKDITAYTKNFNAEGYHETPSYNDISEMKKKFDNGEAVRVNVIGSLGENAYAKEDNGEYSIVSLPRLLAKYIYLSDNQVDDFNATIENVVITKVVPKVDTKSLEADLTFVDYVKKDGTVVLNNFKAQFGVNNSWEKRGLSEKVTSAMKKFPKIGSVVTVYLDYDFFETEATPVKETKSLFDFMDTNLSLDTRKGKTFKNFYISAIQVIDKIDTSSVLKILTEKYDGIINNKKSKQAQVTDFSKVMGDDGVENMFSDSDVLFDMTNSTSTSEESVEKTETETFDSPFSFADFDGMDI